MICDSCKKERLVSDFLKSHKFCYKCVYQEKITKSMRKRTEQHSLCRTCNQIIINKKKEKRRQRTVYCSCECAEKGHKDQVNNYWTRKIINTDVGLKKEECKWNSSQKLTLQGKPRARYTAMRRLTVKKAL